MTRGNERFWLNGRFVGERGANVFLLDRGLLFGDSVYEAIRFYDRRPFLMDDHLARLGGSARALGFGHLEQVGLFARGIRGLISRSTEPDGMIYLQWTRGAAERNLVPDPDMKPTLFAIRFPLPRPPVSIRRRGAPVVTTQDERWHRTELKTTNLLGNVLARMEADESGAYETVLYRGGGKRARVTEGTSTSVFAVVRGTLMTPRLKELLPGITRNHTLRIAEQCGIQAVERTITLDDLLGAEEAFLTATSLEILPIRSIDGVPMGDSVPGPLTKRLCAAFHRFRANHLRSVIPVP